jgi:hypothetical protein
VRVKEESVIENDIFIIDCTANKLTSLSDTSIPVFPDSLDVLLASCHARFDDLASPLRSVGILKPSSRDNCNVVSSVLSLLKLDAIVFYPHAPGPIWIFPAELNEAKSSASTQAKSVD